MLSQDQSGQYIARLIEARKKAIPITKVPALSESTQAEAYEVQKAALSMENLEFKDLAGWKAAMGTRAAMERFKITDPIYGALPRDMLVTDGVASSKSFISPKLEAEVAFILKQSLKGGGISNDEIIQAIGYVAPAYEIADCRIENWGFDIPHFISDNAVAAGYLLGKAIPFTDPSQVAGISCTLHVGKEIFEGKAEAVLGGPMASFIKMIRGILDIYGEVHEGQLFLSGSLTKPIDMQAGNEYVLKMLGSELKLKYI
ncbi:MAG: hypothetical protein JXR18_05670 [Neptuniibacter sp.]